MLFRAFAGLEAARGMRKRNMFARQLMEMGLMVMEERMRRQDGVSTRVFPADSPTNSAPPPERWPARPGCPRLRPQRSPNRPPHQEPIDLLCPVRLRLPPPKRPSRRAGLLLPRRPCRRRLLLIPHQLHRSRRSPLQWPGTSRQPTTTALLRGLAAPFGCWTASRSN